MHIHEFDELTKGCGTQNVNRGHLWIRPLFIGAVSREWLFIAVGMAILGSFQAPAASVPLETEGESRDTSGFYCFAQKYRGGPGRQAVCASLHLATFPDSFTCLGLAPGNTLLELSGSKEGVSNLFKYENPFKLVPRPHNTVLFVPLQVIA